MKQEYQFKVRTETSLPLETVVLSHDEGMDAEKAIETWITLWF